MPFNRNKHHTSNPSELVYQAVAEPGASIMSCCDPQRPAELGFRGVLNGLTLAQRSVDFV
jgi:hypothetical protein